MRYSIPFLFAALIGWIVLGGFFQSATCCSIFAGPALSIKDGATTVASNAKNLIFGVSGNAMDVTNKGVKPSLAKLAGYLNENPTKAVTLTGFYGGAEKNNTSFENLGLGRADAMKKYLIGLGVPATQLLTGSAEKGNLAIDESKLYGGMGYTFSELAGGKGISIRDASAFSAGTDDNFVFGESSYEYKKPISGAINLEFGKTAEYLKKNANRSLRITGLYGKDEKNTGIYDNLGLARANNIKGLLMGMGVAAGQIDLGGKILPSIAFNDAKEFVGGATYAFFDTPNNDNRLAEVEKRLRTKPMILYFATNSENITLSAEQRSYFSDLSYYLDNKKGGKAVATGHTDDRGDHGQNTRLGRKRAEFVKTYLAKNGISTNKTQATSQGPDAPVAGNDTPEGRQKNRRVEITIK